jgi:hypothetical protein
MISQHDLHITCACGRYRKLWAEDVPAAWLDASGLNIHPWVFDRMVCLACGRRGRPMSTVISAVQNRLARMTTTMMPLTDLPPGPNEGKGCAPQAIDLPSSTKQGSGQ